MHNRIRELRKSRGITQSALAQYLGVAQNTLSYWEQGRYDVDNTSLQKIADFFNCSIDFVLCRSEIIKSDTENTNTIKIAGRDGSYEERVLTDDQLELLKKLINALPEATEL